MALGACTHTFMHKSDFKKPGAGQPVIGAPSLKVIAGKYFNVYKI